MGEKKKHKFTKCNKCRYQNDITLCIENDDYDVDKYREGIGYIFCCQCGQQIEIDISNLENK